MGKETKQYKLGRPYAKLVHIFLKTWHAILLTWFLLFIYYLFIICLFRPFYLLFVFLVEDGLGDPFCSNVVSIVGVTP